MTHADPTPDELWIGIDLGTQSVRVLAVDGSGAVAGAGEHPLTSRRNGPRHEQDPEQWWTALRVACGQALQGLPAGAVRGVAVDATSGTVLLADPQGRPLTAALMYDDTRAGDLVEQVNQAGAPLWDALGYQRMQPAWALPKLLWLLREHPDLRGSARLTHQTDLVNRRLVGHDVPTDLASALKTGADLVREDWPTEVMDTLDVPSGTLPPLVRSGTLLGTVCQAAAAATGLPQGTPVLAGTTDGCAAQLGSGALSPGSWNSVLGTTLVLKGMTEQLLHDPSGAVYCHRSPDGRWLPGGASSTGAGALSRDFGGRDLADLDSRAADHEPAAALAYPLVSDGERFPFVARDARPFLLDAGAGETDRYAAMLQGVAFVERLCFDHLDRLGAATGGQLVLTGGATRSRYWCQLRADVLGRTITLVRSPEPALGAAVLASSDGRSLSDAAARMVRVRERIDPREGATSRWDQTYLRLVGELRSRGWLPPATADHAQARTQR